ncbi:MAG: hypothetical protein IT165_01415 [Bryobacterales bacterium]|nr:hypothetical protein [Bryobacterales bacterium]
MGSVRLGDIIEIPTRNGLAYAQYTHQHPQFGGLIRVFDGLFQERPSDFSRLAESPVRFSVFFPVRGAVRRKTFEIAGRSEIAPHNREFPIFRSGFAEPGHKVSNWWFWDGEREWKVGAITAEQRKLPIREVWNDTMLVQRIESGWSPANDPE